MFDLDSLTGANGSPVGFLGCVHFSFVTAATAGGVLRVVRFSGRERLNEPFSYDVMLATSMEYDDVRTSVLGKAARLCVQTASPPSRRIEGLVAAVTALGTFQRQRGDVHQYRVQLVPRLWLLSMRRTLRVFENQSLLDVALSVLADADIKADVRLDPSQYAPVPFVYQRGESDREFVNRLFALAGITYYFEHGLGDAADFPGVDSSFRVPTPPPLGPADVLGRNANEKMVLVDSARRMTGIDLTSGEDGASDPPSLAYDAHGGYGLAREEVSQFELRSCIGPSTAYVQTWSVFDHSPSENSTPIDTSMDATMSAESALVVSEYQRDPALLSQYEIDRQQKLAARALAQHRAATSVAAGKSDSPRLAPGMLFALREHPMDAINAPYYVTSTKCEGLNPQELPAGDEAHVYSTSFECSPVTLEPRPMAPPPRAQLGAEPATVIGGREGCPAVDERGRILVRFHWGHNDPRGDRRLTGTSGECFVQWLERWAGAGYGTSTLPRVGSEVWVEFSRHEGDSPIATGQLYSAANRAPFGGIASSEFTKVGIRTQTMPLYDGIATGYSELSFDDFPGGERVRIRAHRDMDRMVGHNDSVTVEGDRTVRVVGQLKERTEGTVRHSTGADLHTTVAGNSTLHVQGDLQREARAERVKVGDGGRRDTVEGHRTDRIEQDFLSSVGGSAWVTIDGGQRVEVKGDSVTLCKSGASVELGTAETPADSSLVANGVLDLISSDAIHVSAKKSLRLAVGATVFELTEDGITITTKNLKAGVGDTAKVVTKTLSLVATDSAEVTAKTVTVSGSGSQLGLASSATLVGAAVALKQGSGASASQSDDPAQTTPDQDKAKPTLKTTAAHDHFRDYAGRVSELEFALWLRPIFGDDVPFEAFASMRGDLLHGKFPEPAYELTASGAHGHEGGYDRAAQKITLQLGLVQKALVDQPTASRLYVILVEEFGHHVDNLLRTHYSSIGRDGPIDEGSVFAYASVTQELGSIRTKIFGTYVEGTKEQLLVLDHAPLAEAVTKYLSWQEQLDDDRDSMYEFFSAGMGGAVLPFDSPERTQFGHESVEQALQLSNRSRLTAEICEWNPWADILKNHSSGSDYFTPRVLKQVYFGNWLRDNSQIIDDKFLAALRAFPDDFLNRVSRSAAHDGNRYEPARRALVHAIDGWAQAEFDAGSKVRDPIFIATRERIGVYRQDEHIDNPKGIDVDKLAIYGEPFLPATVASDLEIDVELGMKRYIRSANGTHTTTAFIQRELNACFDAYAAGRRADAYRHLGGALHPVEDYYAHSNFLELAMFEPELFSTDDAQNRTTNPFVGRNVRLHLASSAKANPSWSPHCLIRDDQAHLDGFPPIVTGCFGALDALDSVPAGKIEKILGNSNDELTEAVAAWATPTGRHDEESRRMRLLLRAPEDSLDAVAKAARYGITRSYVQLNLAFFHFVQGLLEAIPNAQSFQIGDDDSDPTHSQLSKDHPDHPLHALAAHCAQQAIMDIGISVQFAFLLIDSSREPSGDMGARARAAENIQVARRMVMDTILSYLRHPQTIRHVVPTKFVGNDVSMEWRSTEGPRRLVATIDRWKRENPSGVEEQRRWARQISQWVTKEQKETLAAWKKTASAADRFISNLNQKAKEVRALGGSAVHKMGEAVDAISKADAALMQAASKAAADAAERLHESVVNGTTLTPEGAAQLGELFSPDPLESLP